MKTKFLLWATILVAVALAVGCEKKSTDEGGAYGETYVYTNNSGSAVKLVYYYEAEGVAGDIKQEVTIPSGGRFECRCEVSSPEHSVEVDHVALAKIPAKAHIVRATYGEDRVALYDDKTVVQSPINVAAYKRTAEYPQARFEFVFTPEMKSAATQIDPTKPLYTRYIYRYAAVDKEFEDYFEKFVIYSSGSVREVYLYQMEYSESFVVKYIADEQGADYKKAMINADSVDLVFFKPVDSKFRVMHHVCYAPRDGRKYNIFDRRNYTVDKERSTEFDSLLNYSLDKRLWEVASLYAQPRQATKIYPAKVGDLVMKEIETLLYCKYYNSTEYDVTVEFSGADVDFEVESGRRYVAKSGSFTIKPNQSVELLYSNSKGSKFSPYFADKAKIIFSDGKVLEQSWDKCEYLNICDPAYYLPDLISGCSYEISEKQHSAAK